jgi:hypothetical protein
MFDKYINRKNLPWVESNYEANATAQFDGPIDRTSWPVFPDSFIKHYSRYDYINISDKIVIEN